MAPDPHLWHPSEAVELIRRMERTNKQMFAWLVFTSIQTVIAWVVVFWAVAR